MRGYSETEVFSKAARKLLARARDLVKGLPDPAEGSEPLRCHEVARVVAQKLAGQVCGLGALVLDVEETARRLWPWVADRIERRIDPKQFMPGGDEHLRSLKLRRIKR